MENGSSKPYAVEEAADRAGINVKTMYQAIREGQVPSVRIGKRILVPRAAFDRLLSEGTKA